MRRQKNYKSPAQWALEEEQQRKQWLQSRPGSSAFRSSSPRGVAETSTAAEMGSVARRLESGGNAGRATVLKVEHAEAMRRSDERLKKKQAEAAARKEETIRKVADAAAVHTNRVAAKRSGSSTSARGASPSPNPAGGGRPGTAVSRSSSPAFRSSTPRFESAGRDQSRDRDNIQNGKESREASKASTTFGSQPRGLSQQSQSRPVVGTGSAAGGKSRYVQGHSLTMRGGNKSSMTGGATGVPVPLLRVKA